jgi:hypothetical protein
VPGYKPIDLIDGEQLVELLIEPRLDQGRDDRPDFFPPFV